MADNPFSPNADELLQHNEHYVAQFNDGDLALRPRRQLTGRPPLGAKAWLLVLLAAEPAAAHPLDEVVQGAYLTLAPGQVRLELDLTPGVQVSGAVLKDLDANGDRRITGALLVAGFLAGAALGVGRPAEGSRRLDRSHQARRDRQPRRHPRRAAARQADRLRAAVRRQRNQIGRAHV